MNFTERLPALALFLLELYIPGTLVLLFYDCIALPGGLPTWGYYVYGGLTILPTWLLPLTPTRPFRVSGYWSRFGYWDKWLRLVLVDGAFTLFLWWLSEPSSTRGSGFLEGF